MKHLGNLALIGSGPTAIYLLCHIAAHARELSGIIRSITVLEKTSMGGYGMPYHPETTDIHNLSNISPEEIPALPQSFDGWLAQQDADRLREWKIDPADISPSGIYGRLPLGEYLRSQYLALVSSIAASGIYISEETRCEVCDITPDESGQGFWAVTKDGALHAFDSVVIATGHSWPGTDDPENGYYSSPWPISKILPHDGSASIESVGTLGASLSAFDVISSLAHRHGEFREESGKLGYIPNPGTEGFHITMHSENGWLPNLQYDQSEPLRAIYRHVSRPDLLALLDPAGRLRLADYFDAVCRPALTKAFEKDGLPEMAAKMQDPDFSFQDFTENMEDRHEYKDAFTGMRRELGEALDSIGNSRPIHWKEVFDDLIYTLNFHAELLPAEDHLALKSEIMPFLMNVIAAMPIPSARMLLALHEAGKLELVSGRVDIRGIRRSGGSTSVPVETDGGSESFTYRMFIDCSGQKPIDLKHYPFQGLVAAGKVRSARAEFASEKEYQEHADDDDGDLFIENGKFFLHTGGIDIDPSHRLVGNDGKPDPGIYDLSFPHATGVRPYSYGLQACDATAGIVVLSWLASIARI